MCRRQLNLFIYLFHMTVKIPAEEHRLETGLFISSLKSLACGAGNSAGLLQQRYMHLFTFKILANPVKTDGA